MWIFTNFGFVSAVKHRNKDNTLMVRAREPGVLKMLCKRHGVKAKVIKTRNADYLYRADIPKDKFAEMISEEVMNIDYPNFKNSFKAAIKKHTNKAHDALMDVWCIMHRLQTELEYGGTTPKNSLNDIWG